MARKQRRNSVHTQHNNVYALTEAISLNGRAAQEGPKRKTWSRHDLKNVRPLTPAQTDMFHDFFAGNNIVAYGSAGTGKSYVALYLAISEYLKQDSCIEQILVVRSAVPTREIGFLPGTLEEKAAIYELPYKDIFADLMGRGSTYDDMKEAGIVKFCTTSFIRGLTWDNTIVVVDEAQSMTFHELNSLMTRLGDGSRIILCGDHAQTDLVGGRGGVSGFEDFVKVANAMDMFSTVKFHTFDIVRSEFVKSWLIKCEQMGMV